MEETPPAPALAGKVSSDQQAWVRVPGLRLAPDRSFW